MIDQVRILVVDDDRTARMVLEYALMADGFEVYTAEDGLAGLEIAREKVPDIILLDWMMPKMNGLEMLSRLRTDEVAKHIPVFMLSSRFQEREIVEAFDKGIDAYITKPFNIVKLGKTIRRKLLKYGKV